MAPPQLRTTRSAKARESTKITILANKDDRRPSSIGDEYAQEVEFESP